MTEVRREMEKETGFLRALQVMIENDMVLPVGLIPAWLLYFILFHGPRLHPALTRSHKMYLQKTCQSVNLLGVGLGGVQGHIKPTGGDEQCHLSGWLHPLFPVWPTLGLEQLLLNIYW